MSGKPPRVPNILNNKYVKQVAEIVPRLLPPRAARARLTAVFFRTCVRAQVIAALARTKDPAPQRRPGGGRDP